MKKYIIYIIAILFISCNDVFLEKYPKTSLTEENAFQTYDNFKAFMMPCYEMFINTDIATSVTHANGGFAYSQDAQYRGDLWASYLTHRYNYNPYAFQTIPNVSSGNGWNFTYIRRINIMLSHISDATGLSNAEKDHWKAVGYFFHSFWYMELVNRFGDVPWVNKVLDETTPETYGPRINRKIVGDSMLMRLKWAEEHIGNFQNKDGKNAINQDVVQAALSRFALREATWRKYHDLGDYNVYLNECARVCEILMDKYPTLYMGTDGQPAAGYGEMWTTEDLSKVPGIILYKEYRDPVLLHGNCFAEHTSSHLIEMPQHTVDMYLCKDGKTIYNSPLYAGDKDIYSTFRNRDPRLYHSIMPPYKVKAGKGDYPSWSFTGNPADREYIDILGINSSCSNPGIGMKRLPAQNWAASLLTYIPNLQNGVSGVTKDKAFNACRSGYYFWKNYDQWETNYNMSPRNTSDKPIFKIEEVLLNYAECKWEQGQFTQAIADKTINKLRKRANMADMNVSEINANFDPKRDLTVDPILWEIRRERMIELMGEGFGFDDVRRWKKAPWYINRQPVGMWIKQSQVNESLWDETTHLPTKSKAEGYIYLWADPLVEGKGWLDKYYLYQIPTDEIVLNPALTQNPGY